MQKNKEIIAKNSAALLGDGEIVNLGVGIPSLVANYLTDNKKVFLHSENGCVGVDKTICEAWDINNRASVISWMEAHKGELGHWTIGHKDLNNASDEAITLIPGAFCMDSIMSFVIACGGHLDTTVLGGLQVDVEGNLANWTVPGKKINGMGGAMDLASGANRVIVAMEHCTKEGSPKLLQRCSFPLTAVHCVDVIVTELCICQIQEGCFVVEAMAPNITKEALQAKTGANLKFRKKIKTMLSL